MKIYIKNILLFLFFLIVFLVYIFINISDFEPIINKQVDKVFSSNNQIKESCLNCHQQFDGFSDYHNPQLIGCSSCHLGNKHQQEKEKAHHGMVLIPGNLKDAKNTCGKCHKEHLSKIEFSLMTTNSGLVAVNKFVFGEAENPNGFYHINNINFTPAEKHLRDLCANCHLGAEKKDFGSIHQKSRGGGCNACHLNYTQKSEEDLRVYQSSNKKKLPKTHPELNLQIKNEHCFGCHSRSSRIATSYEGWSETLLKKHEVIHKKDFRVLEDQRVFAKQSPDVHHTKGILCIDCHSSHEVMGDGKKYIHQEDAVSVQCTDCHFTDLPKTITLNQLDAESAKIATLRKYNLKDKKIVVKSKSGQPLINTYLDEKNKPFMISKNDGKIHQLSKQSPICQKDIVHANLTCSSCHTSWASKCIGCHNQYDKNDKMGFDLLDQKYVKGQWVEYVHEFSVSEPSLGVRVINGKKEIKPAVPGMIMTIDKGSYQNKPGTDVVFHRLFAPNAPHTISKKGRSCVSCHLNPYVLGYGSGKLVLHKNGKFQLQNSYALNEFDQLPEDAWIPFLSNLDHKKNYSTRTNFRPFNLVEQQNILKVGACLTCHQPDDKTMKQSLTVGIDVLMLKKSKLCLIPNFKK
ncbi:MAG: hypothetical protein Q7U08_10255 [Flavobacteriaceae bacterium]|nr:hypothetical protein [Flavobacteriaceae bacterium]